MSAWVLVHRIDGEGQPPTVGSVARERERREVGASLAALQEPADRLTVMAERAAGVHTVDRVERGGGRTRRRPGTEAPGPYVPSGRGPDS
jgi:hypothetical protein